MPIFNITATLNTNPPIPPMSGRGETTLGLVVQPMGEGGYGGIWGGLFPYTYNNNSTENSGRIKHVLHGGIDPPISAKPPPPAGKY